VVLVAGKCTRASSLGSRTSGFRNAMSLSLLMVVSGMDVRDAFECLRQIVSIGGRKLAETKSERVSLLGC
jgi:hypothetical protein